MKNSFKTRVPKTYVNATSGSQQRAIVHGSYLAGVLAADVLDAGAQHVSGDIGPVGETGLRLQPGVLGRAPLLVDDVDVHVLKLLGGGAARLE